jgi:hypothetical protein
MRDRSVQGMAKLRRNDLPHWFHIFGIAKIRCHGWKGYPEE